MITVTFLDAVATVYVLTGSNNDIKIFEIQPVLFVHDYIKSSSRIERINKLQGYPTTIFGNVCSEDDLRSRIFGTFVVKFLACLPLLGFSNF